jgi:hypothetical protein
MMPAGFGIGDHQLFVIDFCATDVTDNSLLKVVCPHSRWLITKLPRVASSYNRILEKELIAHCMIKKLSTMYRSSCLKRKLARSIS